MQTAVSKLCDLVGVSSFSRTVTAIQSWMMFNPLPVYVWYKICQECLLPNYRPKYRYFFLEENKRGMLIENWTMGILKFSSCQKKKMDYFPVVCKVRMHRPSLLRVQAGITNNATAVSLAGTLFSYHILFLLYQAIKKNQYQYCHTYVDQTLRFQTVMFLMHKLIFKM